MCDECGCGLPETAKGERGAGPGHRVEEVRLFQNLLDANRSQAEENREHLMEHGILAVNLMSSPGSGKTTLIEALHPVLRDGCRVGVIEGDLATERDAERIRALHLPVWQVTTGSTCHLDAAMVHRALHQLPLDDLDLLFVENVGNLVCPGFYDLGCHLNGVLLSVAEGDDKVMKYPVVFRHAQFLAITKTDLLPHVDFDTARPRREARIIKGDIKVFEMSARTGEGIGPFAEHLASERRALEG